MRTPQMPQPQAPSSTSRSRANDSLVEMPTQWMQSRTKRDGHEQLPGRLRPLVQAEVPLEPDAEVVVDEPDEGAADDETHQAQTAALEPLAAGPQVTDDVAGQRRRHDGHPAHGRRAGLGGVAAGAVLPDLLADTAGPKHPDQQRRPGQGQDERGGRRQQQDAITRGSLQQGIGDPFETHDPAGLDQHRVTRPQVEDRAPPPQPARCRPRPLERRPLVLPRPGQGRSTATRSFTPVAATSLPSRWCSPAECGPSSAIGPRTAKRRPRPATPGRRSAAAIDVGLAL